MTVNLSESRAQYNGNGTTTTFIFAALLLRAEDLLVTLLDTDRNIVPVNLGGSGDYDYLVTGNYDDDYQGYTNGANCVFNIAPPLGYEITLSYQIDLTQITDFVNNDDFPANTLERGLDKLTLALKELEEKIGRTLSVPISSQLKDLTLDSELQPGATLVVNDDVTGFDTGPSLTQLTNLATEIETTATDATNQINTAATNATGEIESSVDQAEDAAARAELAASQVAATDTVNISNADSPYSLIAAQNNYIVYCDTSAGAVVVQFPKITSNGLRYTIVKNTTDTNVVTVQKDAADTINGTESISQYQKSFVYISRISTDPTVSNFWELVEISENSVGTAQLIDGAVTLPKIATGVSLGGGSYNRSHNNINYLGGPGQFTIPDGVEEIKLLMCSSGGSGIEASHSELYSAGGSSGNALSLSLDVEEGWSVEWCDIAFPSNSSVGYHSLIKPLNVLIDKNPERYITSTSAADLLDKNKNQTLALEKGEFYHLNTRLKPWVESPGYASWWFLVEVHSEAEVSGTVRDTSETLQHTFLIPGANPLFQWTGKFWENDFELRPASETSTEKTERIARNNQKSFEFFFLPEFFDPEEGTSIESAVFKDNPLNNNQGKPILDIPSEYENRFGIYQGSSSMLFDLYSILSLGNSLPRESNLFLQKMTAALTQERIHFSILTSKGMPSIFGPCSTMGVPTPRERGLSVGTGDGLQRYNTVPGSGGQGAVVRSTLSSPNFALPGPGGPSYINIEWRV